VTLRFFGELTSAEVERAVSVLAALAPAQQSGLEVSGGPETRLLGSRLVVWPVKGLTGLAREVEKATGPLGEPAPNRPFAGHITLARSRGRDDLRSSRHELAQLLSLTWPVNAFSLVQSQLGPKGARYSELAHFELGGPPAGT